MFNKSLLSSNNDNYETPFYLFNKLDSVFNFDYDLCADFNNHLKEKYFSVYDSFLEKFDFTSEDNCFINPPYSMLSEFVLHCYRLACYGVNICMLIPSRTDTKYFHNYIYNKDFCRIVFLRGRIKFCLNGITCKSSPFPSMLVIYNFKDISNIALQSLINIV